MRQRPSQRYGPLLSVGLVLFLALAVLPSALTLPQTNPSTTLEYAPVPPSDEDADPPPGGSLSSLSLATSGSLGVGDGEGEGAGAGGGGAGGVGKSPRTKRCVGNPPRQTEDPMSPPCVAFFAGDNFGRTHQGVDREEIRILYYHECGIYNITSTGAETPHCGETWDLAEPPDSSRDHFAARVLRAYQRYFNDRYMTYNRFAHFYLAFSSSNTQTAETRRASAADHYARFRPFATLSYTTSGNEGAYLDFMAQRGVLNFGSDQGRDEAFFNRYPKLIWGYLPSQEIQAKMFGGWVCQKVVNRPVSFSGNAGENGRPRKLGLLWNNDPDFDNFKRFADLSRRHIEDCGGKIAVERSFVTQGCAVSCNSDQQTAAANMASFKQANVTTIIWPQAYETLHSNAAAQIDYRPEWVIAGDRAHDGWNASGYQEQSVWRHAWVLSNEILQPAQRDTQCWRAAKEGDPNVADQDLSAACSFRQFYTELRQLFTGIQVAGPRLTPDTIDRGFHAIPSIASTDPTVPACYYDPGDYTCVKDAVPMWWDETKSAPGAHRSGCWRMPEGGRRYIPGSWPQGDVTAQRDAVKDPCNAFGGVFFF